MQFVFHFELLFTHQCFQTSALDNLWIIAPPSGSINTFSSLLRVSAAAAVAALLARLSIFGGVRMEKSRCMDLVSSRTELLNYY